MIFSENTVYIIYGSRSGNSRAVAVLAKEYASFLGLQCYCESMEGFDLNSLKNIENLIIIVSTHGEGEPPVPAEGLHAFIHTKNAPYMTSTKYAVLGLGDSSYRYFCNTGADFDHQLEKLGASRILPLEKCDIDFEEKSKEWIKKIIGYFANILPKNHQQKNKQFIFDLNLDNNTQYNTYKATVLKKVLINRKDAAHPTMNITFSLKDSGISFHPGDLIGIYATNSRVLVDKLLKTLDFDPTNIVAENKSKKMLKEALIYDYELTLITPLVIKKYADLIQNSKLTKMLKNEEQLDSYVKYGDVLDIVTDFKGNITPDSFLKILRKLTPRLYSVASYMKDGQKEVDLTIRVINYKYNNREHEGVCSYYAWNRLEPGDKVPLFLEANEKFRLPGDFDIPVIMIGTGTGIAPFRSFLQYRSAYNARGRNWLFFGERKRSQDFFYQDELLNYQQSGLLTKLDTAFSRDSNNKHYISLKLLERGQEVYQWIREGAHIYICGNKNTMANDVRNALSELIRINGKLTKDQTVNFIKKLRLEKRLQEDVY